MGPPTPPAPRPAWRLDWLTPGRCRWILAAILAFGFFSRLYYLNNNPPIDLAPDECHYWDWSRNLQLSYYSKPPMVALLIRASCALFGDVPAAVRYPAMLLAVGTSLCTYRLTTRLFGSERLALGAVLVSHMVPMFIAGSLLMTIDPPFVFFWALGTTLVAEAMFGSQRKIFWPLAGLAIGLSFLSKYPALLWYIALLIALATDRAHRRWLATPWPYIAAAVTALCMTPVILWNARNGWPTVGHVGADLSSGFKIGNAVNFFLGQFLLIGPVLVVGIIGGAILALRGQSDAARRGRFLLCIGGTFFAFVAATAYRTKVQMNWTGPTWFTLLILSAWFFSTRLADLRRWRHWRPWLYGTAVVAVGLMTISHDTRPLYPFFKWAFDKRLAMRENPKPEERVFKVKSLDPSGRLKGIRATGQRVSEELAKCPPGSVVFGVDYQNASALAFYVTGQPKTYNIGTYIINPGSRGRRSQFDLWPDRSLEPDKTLLKGRDAIYVGYPFKEVLGACESYTELPPLNVTDEGYLVSQARIYRLHNFRGIPRPVDRSTKD